MNTQATICSPRNPTSTTVHVRPKQVFTISEMRKRMAVLSDEGGIFLIMAGLYSGGSASLDVFLQAHAGSGVRVNRADREAYLTNPVLTFALLLQPGILADVASNKRFFDSGLLARFLYGLPESTVGKRDVRNRIGMPAEVLTRYEAGINALLDGRRLIPEKPVSLCFDASALECWIEFLEEIEVQLGDSDTPEMMIQWKSKLPGAVARIAGLIELAEGMGRAHVIGADAVTRAIAIGRLLIPHAEAAFGLFGADIVESDAAALLKWAQSCGSASFSRRDCQKAMKSRFRTVESLKKAADRLVERDVLRESKDEKNIGRPSVRYRINPKVLPLLYPKSL